LPGTRIRYIVVLRVNERHFGMGNMSVLNRRAFVETSLGGFAASCLAPSLAAAQQCVSGGLPNFLPNSVMVDCASTRNFRTFRQYPEYVGLAGVVSMTTVRGALGTYPAGNLFLFPWLKKKVQASAVLPANATQCINSNPIPNAQLPVDEYFCRYMLQAPWTSFIGFQVDKPYTSLQANQVWFTNVDKLADGKGVGIDWTSSNLNNAWFGGSNWIPNTEACDGNAWRRLIVRGLSQASTRTC
jgi:hypothetical protein